MAPKRRPANVVRSGNAGNSSKPKPTPEPAPQDGPPRPPPLFPPGYKTPVQMLNEKCQKAGWERPLVESKANRGSSPETFTGVVTLRKRVSKNIYDLDQVRLTPHPPLELPSAAEAKHWAATYAMFRFCSHLPMAMTLPPSIRPYWSTLTAEKAAAPPHRAWEWNPDPFAAKKEVEERQTKKKDKEKAAEEANGDSASGRSTPRPNGVSGAVGAGGGGREWENAPEVRMAPTLRESVDGTVRRMMQRFPAAILEATREASSTASTMPSGSTTPPLDLPNLTTQLTTLGFRPSHITSALTALSAANARLHSSSTSMNDPLVLSLSILSPLEAAIEWLLLHLPEDDLPQRYRTTTSASDFVTGASIGGQNALVKGWLLDKLTKQAGFPRKAVEQVIKGEERESAALDILGRRLCGWDDDWGPEAYVAWMGDEAESEARGAAREEEIMALEAVLGERYQCISPTESTIDIEHNEEKITLHVLFDESSPYPSPSHPTYPPSFYLTSDDVPSYMRLHLQAQLLRQFRDPERHDFTSVLEAGAGGAVLLMVEYLESVLPEVLSNPPDIGEVTKYLVPRADEVIEDASAPRAAKRKTARPQVRRRIPTAADEDRLQKQHAEMLADPAYAKILQDRQKLPAWKEAKSITPLLDTNRVVVIVGETGCGKTTQLPQFILDNEIAQRRGASTNIIVTQPRRVAAMGVASRVAYERMEDLDKSPGTVGYAIRGERRASNDTRLLFCTTGVVLRRLGSGDKDLEGVSHVIVDEAHERGVDTDLLICLLRDLLERNKTIKVVLMSATINEKIFIDYFGGCPSLSIPGFTHPVKDHYLEDVVPLLRDFAPTANRVGPRQTEEQKVSLRNELEKLNLDATSQRTLEVLAQADRIDYNLVASVVKHIVATSDSGDGAILVFMPGVMEIRQCVSALQSTSLGPVEILPLHANLTSAEQRRVFLPTKPKRKIVVSTNVAETSVTIPDVVYVVDGGRVKETQYDASSGMQKLVETWTSRASGRQRRGRAGRTQPGQCYKLYTRRQEANSMPRFGVPEMLRTPLESLFLQVKAMDETVDVHAFLSKAIDPPKLDALESAWQTLLDLGAVSSSSPSAPLTALGRHMSSIPVDLRLAKMLVLGVIFRCLDPILTIAALLSSKPLFTSPIEKRDESRAARLAFSSGRSDLLTDVKAYNAVVALKGAAQRNFCEDKFISASCVRDITTLRQEFLGALQGIGFIQRQREQVERYSLNKDLDGLVKGVVVGGLYPRVARISLPGKMFERVQQGAVLKAHEAKEVKLFDDTGRVFLHPTSVLFDEAGFKPGFVAYFAKAETSKVFLRDATEVPLYSLLLFGGPLTINHFIGGVMVGKGERNIKLRAQTRIGVLCSQLRRLLDAQLMEAIESPDALDSTLAGGGGVTGAMMALLARDGLTQ